MQHQGVFLVVQVYWYYDRQTGEFHYRLEQPARALNQTGRFQVVNLHVHHPLLGQLAIEADLLIVHLVPDIEITELLRLRKALGKPTIFEFADDVFVVGEWMDRKDGHFNPVLRGQWLWHAYQSQGIQVNTKALKMRMEGLHDDIQVFHNHVEGGEGPLSQPRAVGPLKLGWGGSSGHRNDLLAIREVVLSWLASHPNWTFEVMTPHTLFESLFSGVPQVIYREPGDLSHYYEFLSTLDLGLIPLEETAFNRCRSDVKFLEFARHGVPCLVANGTPYRERLPKEVAWFFAHPSELSQGLEALSFQGPLRASLAQRAWDWLNALSDPVEQRVHWYERFLQDVPTRTPIGALPGAEGLMAMVRLGLTRLDEGAMAEAEALLGRAQKEMPGYFQAAYWYREVLLRQGRHEDVLVHVRRASSGGVWDWLNLSHGLAALQILNPPLFRQHLKQLPLDLQLPLAPDEVDVAAILQENPFHALALQKWVQRHNLPLPGKSGELMRRFASWVDPGEMVFQEWREPL
jgi:hypothetical protein